MKKRGEIGGNFRRLLLAEFGADAARSCTHYAAKTSVVGLILTRQGLVYTQDTSFSVKSSLTAVREGAKVPSSDIFDLHGKQLHSWKSDE